MTDKKINEYVLVKELEFSKTFYDENKQIIDVLREIKTKLNYMIMEFNKKEIGDFTPEKR